MKKIVTGLAALAFCAGGVLVASPSGAQGGPGNGNGPGNPWNGQGSEHVEACADGGVYHWVFNRYQGDPSAFELFHDGAHAPSKITRGTVHFHVETAEAPVIDDVEVADGFDLATGGLVLSGCEPTDIPPPYIS